MSSVREDDTVADLRRDARKIFYAAVHAAEPAPLVHAALLNAPELREPRGVHVIAIGKAAPGMATAAIETLGDRMRTCTVVAPVATIDTTGFPTADPRIELIASSHPLPDHTSVNAARDVIDRIAAAPRDDIIVALISGGASSLIALPHERIAIEAYRETVELLLQAGADIRELNRIRRRIDQVKGGGLARVAGERTVLCLVISDVVGNAIDIIGSGPFVSVAAHSANEKRETLEIVDRLDLSHKLPASVLELLQNDEPRDELGERQTDNNNVRVQIIADNAHALEAAALYARRLGYHVAKILEPVTGVARDAGRALASQIQSTGYHTSANTCIIAGGETVVRVRGSGSGGRNQEMALSAAVTIDGVENTVFLSGGTDGIDGVTTAAGAIVDGATCARIRAAGLDPAHSLDDNDSFSALSAAGDLLMTGATGTNVLDVHILLRSGDTR